ncbi:hypothetical protein BST61_g6204 [Cercospora zeina]
MSEKYDEPAYDGKVAHGSERSHEVSGSSTPSEMERLQDEKRTIGTFSAAFLIFNRVVGTGIFATPATIYRLSGSTGMALMLWVIGICIASAGMAVYLEFGTGIPKNGGEKNYLEYIYRHPRFIATAFYTPYIMLLGWAGGNSVIFGQYILLAAEVEVTRWNQRGIAMACVTTACVIHATNVKLGLKLQNFLGFIKLLIVLIIVVAGWAALAGVTKLETKPDNFTNAFAGTTNDANAIVAALYSVIWSFIGYSNANYALRETKDPVRTLKIAAPTALTAISVIYMFCNIAYFAGVPRDQLLTSGSAVSANFFRNVMGGPAARALSVFVALSAFGNVLSVVFSQARIVQELGREGITPFHRFFSSNRPFNAPAAGLFWQWLTTSIIILAPPPGDAYSLILNMVSYPLNAVNTIVGLGLVYLYFFRREWNPPFKCSWPVALFFGLANVYLVIAPLIPPTGGRTVYAELPYWLHVAIGWGIIGAGGVYYLVWVQILPRIGKYTLDRETTYDKVDGWERYHFVKRYHQS